MTPRTKTQMAAALGLAALLGGAASAGAQDEGAEDQLRHEKKQGELRAKQDEERFERERKEGGKAAEKQLEGERDRQREIERDRGAFERQEGAITDPARILEQLHFTAQYDVRLSQLAVDHATSKKVRALAKDVVEDQQKIDRRVIQAAQELGIELTPPVMASTPRVENSGSAGTEHTPEGRRTGRTDDPVRRRRAIEQLERLASLTGREFDLEFLRMTALGADGTRLHFTPIHDAIKDKDDGPSDKVDDIVEDEIEDAKDRAEDAKELMKDLGASGE